MDVSSLALLGSLSVLLVLSGFFSASETAFSSLNHIKIKKLAESGDKRALKALFLTKNYDKLLSTVLIGNNIVNIGASALATLLFVELFGKAGVGVATLITTVFVLIAGEISPKTLAKEAPERFALFSAPFLMVLVVFLEPVNRFLSLWKDFIKKIFKIKTDRSVTEAELLTFVEEVRQEGGINEREEAMIRRAFAFDDITAKEIFTPRIDVIAVSIADSMETIDAKFRETDFSRLPVYEGDIDHIAGIILFKDFYRAFMKKDEKSVSSIMKPAVFTTETIKIAKLLKILQKKKAHIAVLVDEFGGMRGIITIEDILEEIVGEIWDEHDEIIESIVKSDNNSYKVLGNVDIEDVFALFPKIKTQETRRRSTVASWVVETLGGVPKEGDVFDFEGLHIIVTKIKRHRIMELCVSEKDGA